VPAGSTNLQMTRLSLAADVRVAAAKSVEGGAAPGTAPHSVWLARRDEGA
jgi:hypothetical protein